MSLVVHVCIAIKLKGVGEETSGYEMYESPLGKSDNSVLIITFRCYAEIANDTRLIYYHDQGDYNGRKAKLDHTDWSEILGRSTINHQWLGFKEYIKKIEAKFIPRRLVININRHKGKVPLNKKSVKKIYKKTLNMEALHGDKSREILY